MDGLSSSVGGANVRIQYVANERTAGFTAVYGGRDESDNVDFSSAMAFSGAVEQTDVNVGANGDEGGFGFFDLLDMINPFHHIPLVNIAYRALTGDEIKPISQIIGGAVFGGVAGVANGVVNAVVREETGKDIAENAIALFVRDDAMSKTSAAENMNIVKVEVVQNEIERMAYDDLPVTLLEFAQKPLSHFKL